VSTATEQHEPVPPAVKKYVVARTSEVPEGERLIVEVSGREIGIFNIEGEFYALLHRCPHLGGPLCRGQVLNLIYAPAPGDVRFDASRYLLTCPWHNWEFDIRTGQSYWSPERLRARQLPVGVESGEAVAGALERGSAERVPGPIRRGDGPGLGRGRVRRRHDAARAAHESNRRIHGMTDRVTKANGGGTGR
jgi:nitrite reductase/ring-hydroxylating ferredoxin subunit